MTNKSIEKLFSWIALLAALYHLVVLSQLLGFLRIFVPLPLHRAVSLSFALFLLYVSRTTNRKPRTGMLPWYDVLLLAAGIKGVVLCTLLVISVLEAVRRVTGWALPALILAILLSTMFNNYLPGILQGRGYPPERIGYSIYVGAGGIFGIPLGVASSIIIVFLIFSGLFQASGGGEWFIDLAMSITGRMRGGAAKGAVVGSSLFATISGSPSANIATTGTFTIPLMIRTGYRPEVAGAVEAAASAGGQIMPPVMGSIAFVMAEWLGVPYATVAKAAFLPAILYFVIIFASVHLEAVRTDLKPLPQEAIPSFWKTLLRGWFFLVPLGSLIYFLLVRGFRPEMAGLLSLPLIVACSFLHHDRGKRLGWQRISVCLQDAVRGGWLTVTTITAAVGVIVGSLELSGLSVKISAFIVDLSGGHLLIILFMVGMASLILGMGLDAIPLYITLTILTAPALIKLGVPALAAHLYVIYWGLASFLTPPVCIGVYVACSISASDVWKTGWEAVKIGVGKYLLPIAFVLEPGLLLQGSWRQIVFAMVTALLGCIALSAGIRGFALREMNWIQKGALIVGGILAVLPGGMQLLIGIGLIGFSLSWQHLTTYREHLKAP
jgi:TRAP transporter 4TM/12TM fusion protein